MPSDGSHMGSVSADSIGLDSIGDPLTDGLLDQAQQERGGRGSIWLQKWRFWALSLAVKTPSSIWMLMARREGMVLSPRADLLPSISYSTTSNLFFSRLTLKRPVK